jgi:SAM-dependent methyltransferase
MDMEWDPDRYTRWFEAPEGQFALDREAQLLQAVVAGWPRRGRKLLEIGCGTGTFLDLLYQMGFDVTGIDSSQQMVDASRQRFGHRADISHGNGELTRFEENAFDYAVLWSVLEFTKDPAAMLREATRIAKKGLLVGCLNRNSLYYRMNVRGSSGSLAKGTWLSWCEMQDLLFESTGHRPTIARSVLPGPMQTWRSTGIGKRINCCLMPPSLGAFAAARIDFVSMKPLTPIFAWKTEPEMG